MPLRNATTPLLAIAPLLFATSGAAEAEEPAIGDRLATPAATTPAEPERKPYDLTPEERADLEKRERAMRPQKRQIDEALRQQQHKYEMQRVRQNEDARKLQKQQEKANRRFRNQHDTNQRDAERLNETVTAPLPAPPPR